MQEIDLYIVTLLHFDNKLKTLAPIFYTLIFVIFLGNNLLFGELLLGKAQPFQYITITLSCSIVIHYALIKLCCYQKVYITQEIHFIGIGCSLLILSALLSYEFNVMSFYSIFIIKGWIAQSINETHLLGEIYKKDELICLIGISIGAIFCTFEWTLQLWGIIFGWLGAAAMVLMAHNLKKIKKTKTHTITQYCLLYSLIVLGLFYPVHKFGVFNIELITYSLINGVLFPICLTIFLHSFQIGCPSMNWAIFMLINMSGAALQIGHQFDWLSILGIIICLLSIAYLLLNHKPYIEIGGFEIEPADNPYYELNEYNQRV